MSYISSFLNVNGVDLPCPRDGFKYVYSQAVNNGRNSNNAVVGQLVGREIVKFDSMEWVGLTPEKWHEIAEAIKPFFVKVTFWDNREMKAITRTFYHGDITCEPLFVDKDTHEVTIYKSCKFNLIDCGFDE